MLRVEFNKAAISEHVRLAELERLQGVEKELLEENEFWECRRCCKFNHNDPESIQCNTCHTFRFVGSYFSLGPSKSNPSHQKKFYGPARKLDEEAESKANGQSSQKVFAPPERDGKQDNEKKPIVPGILLFVLL